MLSPPLSENELNQRVKQLAGLTIAQVALNNSFQVPSNLNHNKGWIGQLIEAALGTSAKNLSEPDFLELGIELKTIPVKANGYPAETTYVCQVPLANHLGLQWEQSCVAKKLNRVLWLPIESNPSLSLAERKIGNGFIWSPSPECKEALKEDWEELMEYVALGQIESVDASYGEYLQIRPKAANAKSRTRGISYEGYFKATLPRGFYLRTSFTHQILQENLIP